MTVSEKYIKVHISNLEKLRELHKDNDALYETLTDVLNMLDLPLSNENNLLYERFKGVI